MNVNMSKWVYYIGIFDLFNGNRWRRPTRDILLTSEISKCELHLVMFFAKICRLSILPHWIGYLFVSYFYRIVQCTRVRLHIRIYGWFFFCGNILIWNNEKKTTNLCLFFRSIGHCIDKTNIRYLCSSEVVHLKMSPVKPGTWDFVYFCAHFSISMRMFVDMFGIRIRGKRGCIEANA